MYMRLLDRFLSLGLINMSPVRPRIQRAPSSHLGPYSFSAAPQKRLCLHLPGSSVGG